MSRALQGVKEGAMQTSGRRAFQKEGRRNKKAKGKGASQLKEHKEASVAGEGSTVQAETSQVIGYS